MISDHKCCLTLVFFQPILLCCLDYLDIIEWYWVNARRSFSLLIISTWTGHLVFMGKRNTCITVHCLLIWFTVFWRSTATTMCGFNLGEFWNFRVSSYSINLFSLIFLFHSSTVFTIGVNTRASRQRVTIGMHSSWTILNCELIREILSIELIDLRNFLI